MDSSYILWNKFQDLESCLLTAKQHGSVILVMSIEDFQIHGNVLS